MRPRVNGSYSWLGILGLVAIATLLPAARDAAAAATWNRVLTGLSGTIDIAHAGDGSQRLFIAQQAGRIRVVKSGTLQATPFLDLGALTTGGGEQGLLGITFHPQYAANGRFFVNYTRTSDGATVIARYNVSAGNPDVADPASAVVLLTIPQPYANHNGGAVRFGPDGFLYIGMGDGGSGNDPEARAQDKTSLLGKILRIDVNQGPLYTIPPGNPWPTGVGGRAEIFALGLRNPWKISFDRGNGDFWIGDVGQGMQEEVDRLAAGTGAGANFGWRVLEGTFCTGLSGPVTCTDPTLIAPVITYGHIGTSCRGSITGGYVYRGTAVPSLSGKYVYGDFCTGRLWAAQQSGAAWVPVELADTAFSLSTFGEDEAGELYFADFGTGDIYRFAETTPPQPVLQVAPLALAFGNANVGSATADQTVTVANAGGGSLVLSALAIGGANPGDFVRGGTCTATTTLAATQSCVITVRFLPAAAGLRGASLTLASNTGNASVVLSGTGVAVPPVAMPVLTATPAALAFGSVNVGSSSAAQVVSVANTGTGTLILSALAVSGANAGDFTRTGTCTPTTSLAPAQSCTAIITFTPSAAGNRTATVGISSNGGNASIGLSGTAMALPPPQTLVTSASALSFGPVNIGAASVTQTLTLSNQGGGTIAFSAFTMGGDSASAFVRGGTCIVGTLLAGTQTCTVTFVFVPSGLGQSDAVLSIASTGGSVQVTLTGTGVTAGTTLADVIEFYHATLDHFFISALAADITALDSGLFKGWQRTGRRFSAFATAQPGSSPVCRFYIPPAVGDSHFISASPIECADVLTRFPSFTLESPAAMYMYLPHPVTGACPPASIPIYRVWNTRIDSNHRYVADQALRDQMLAKGFVREGYGPDGVAMCSPL